MANRINVFADTTDQPLFIISDAPPSSCNYRCPYCFYHRSIGFEPFEDQFQSWIRAMRAALDRIRRPLYLCIGPRGEPVEVERWWPVFREVLSHAHVRRAAFVSNLSRPIAPFIEGLDPERIGVTGTIHPSQWKDKELGFAAFAENVAYLHRIGVKIVLNYVLTPYQIDDYPRYKAYFEERGVPVTCNLFRGVHKGKEYPESYSPDEWAIVKRHMSDIPYDYLFQSKERSPLGNRCTASRHAINMEADGSVFPCYFVRERLGSIFDEELMLLDENMVCSAQECVCKWSIPLQEEYVRDYRHVGNIHQIVRRPAGEIGTNPFL